MQDPIIQSNFKKTFKSTTKLLQLKKLQTEFPKVKISSSQDSANFIRNFYTDDIGIFESFFILLLNHSNTTIAYAKISQGGITGTVVDIRIIAKYAVEFLATKIILAHNHPSGTLQASEADKTITLRVKQALQLFDITVLDHVILSENGYYSFADEGIL